MDRYGDVYHVTSKACRDMKKHYTRIAMGRLPPIVIEGVEHNEQTAVYEDA